MVTTEKASDGNSSPVQPSQPAPSVAAVASPSDPNLASIDLLEPDERRCLLVLVELIHDSNTTGDIGRTRRSRKSQELANHSKMDDASSNVVVQFPILDEFGHYCSSIGCYSARPPHAIQPPWHLISVSLPVRHCGNTSSHGSPLRGLWAIISPPVNKSLLPLIPCVVLRKPRTN